MDGETVKFTHGCRAIMASAVMEKKEDLGAFIIPCNIGKHKFKKTLYDLDESINLMPYAIHQRLGFDTPTPTIMKLLMVDRSIKKLIGMLYDVL